jgi:uridine kinase
VLLSSWLYEIQIVPGSDNDVAIELITTHIRRQLNERSNQLRQQMAIPSPSTLLEVEPQLEETLIVLPQTKQLKVSFREVTPIHWLKCPIRRG